MSRLISAVGFGYRSLHGKITTLFSTWFFYSLSLPNQSSVSVLPRHLCTSFWTTTKVSSVHALHAQVLCAMTVHPAKNTVHQSIVQIAAYVQLVPTRVLMDPAVYRVLQVTRRNNYFIVDISIVKRQVIRNHFICLARSLYLVIILSFMYFFNFGDVLCN